jgi:hypothetical protein
MVQYWMGVNIDTKQSSELTESALELGEGFLDMGVALYRLLLPRNRFKRIDRARPSVAIRCVFLSADPVFYLLIMRLRRPLVPRDSLLRLPNELFIEIAEYLPHIRDMIFFGAAHTRIWETILPSLNIWADRQCWGGRRLAIVGEYMRMDDLPPGVLDDDDISAITSITSKDKAPKTLYYAARKYPWTPPAGDWRRKFLAPLHRSWETKLPQQVVRAVEAANTPYCLSGPGVLRNLSRRLFVRETALDALTARWKAEIKEDDIHAVVSLPPSLGHALVLRICWSSDPSCNMVDPRGDLTRGPWTGERFDLVLEEEFKDAKGDWEDVSDDICERLHEIRHWFWAPGNAY